MELTLDFSLEEGVGGIGRQAMDPFSGKWIRFRRLALS